MFNYCVRKKALSKARALIISKYSLSRENIEAFQKYQELLVLKGYSERTFKTYTNEFHCLLRLLKQGSVGGLERKHIRAYLLWQPENHDALYACEQVKNRDDSKPAGPAEALSFTFRFLGCPFGKFGVFANLTIQKTKGYVVGLEGGPIFEGYERVGRRFAYLPVRRK